MMREAFSDAEPVWKMVFPSIQDQGTRERFNKELNGEIRRTV